MKEIKILEEMPIILTKHKEFLDNANKYGLKKVGSIILLPDDAVLVKIPTLINYDIKKHLTNNK